MLLLQCLSVVMCCVFIASGAVSGEAVKKAVGDTVSFKLETIVPPFTSITWKQISSGGTIKAIEWEDKETTIPNPRFKGITDLDTVTGQITIKKLQLDHSGVYTIDVSGKEQTQRFELTVIEPVPKPEIKIEPSDNPDVVYLRCEYSEKIIWKNSAGETLKGSTIPPKGESITVKKNGNPDSFYTCTLQNDASSKTSDPVYERDLFKDESSGGPWWIVIIVILIILIIGIIICGVLYKRNEGFREFVDGKCPCIKGKFIPVQNATYCPTGNGTDEKTEQDNSVKTVYMTKDEALLEQPKQVSSPQTPDNPTEEGTPLSEPKQE